MLARDQGELRRSNSQAFDFPKVIALVRRDLKRPARNERAMNRVEKILSDQTAVRMPSLWPGVGKH